MSDTVNNTDHTKEKTMVYVSVAGCWISGHVESECGDVRIVRLVTGASVTRLASEVRETSPRIDDPSAWPL